MIGPSCLLYTPIWHIHNVLVENRLMFYKTTITFAHIFLFYTIQRAATLGLHQTSCALKEFKSPNLPFEDADVHETQRYALIRSFCSWFDGVRKAWCSRLSHYCTNTPSLNIWLSSLDCYQVKHVVANCLID